MASPAFHGRAIWGPSFSISAKMSFGKAGTETEPSLRRSQYLRSNPWCWHMYVPALRSWSSVAILPDTRPIEIRANHQDSCVVEVAKLATESRKDTQLPKITRRKI